MGQVVHLNPPAALPSATNALNTAETVFLGALRGRVAAYRAGEDPLPSLCDTMHRLGVHDAAYSIDQLMAVIARSVRHPVAIHCPRCPHLSDDEGYLLQVASLVQSGDGNLAERVLRTALLSAAGAEFALGPLGGLAELFTGARLLFGRRSMIPARLLDYVASRSQPQAVGPLN
jgi:hypothetical protein